MAMIPIGNFGNDIAAPRPSVHQVDNTQATQALGQAADSLYQKGLQVAAQQRQESEALGRARAANSLLDREMQLRTLQADITGRLQSGELKYDQAQPAFDAAKSLLDPPADIGTLDPVTKENLTRGLKRIDMQIGAGIQTAAESAKKAEFKGQTDTALDTLGKLSGMPGADVSQINAQADSLDALGYVAYGKDWAKKKQDFRDSNWTNDATSRLISSRDSVDGLSQLEHDLTAKGGFYVDKLDPNVRNTLTLRVQSYQAALEQKNRLDAERMAREQEKRLRDAENAYNVFQGLADKGVKLDPVYIDQAIQLTQGTPYQEGIKALVKQSVETGGIAAQPLKVQQQLLDSVNGMIALNGNSPELDKRREQIRRIVAGSESDLKDNGLRAGLERGIIAGITPIDMSSPDAMMQGLQGRLDQARTVSAWAGRSVSPLDSGEADALKNMLDILPVKQKSQAIASLAQNVGPGMSGAIAEQIAKKDRPLSLAFSYAGSATTAGRYTSELILNGAQAIKDGTVMKDDKKVTGWRGTIAGLIDGAFPNEQLSSATKDAAYYIAAGIAQENGGAVSSNDLKRAVRIAVGGDIVTRNEQKLPIPAQMTLSQFNEALTKIPADSIIQQAPDSVVRAGGVEVPVLDFVKSIPGQNLIFAGYGQYAVVVRGRPVTNSAGQPIILKVR